MIVTDQDETEIYTELQRCKTRDIRKPEVESDTFPE